EGAPTLVRRLAPPPPDGLANAMDRRAESLRSALAGVAVFLAPTVFMRDRTVEFGIDPSRIRVWPLGAIAGPARRRRAGPRRRFGFIGTLAPHKGVDVLVQAFRGLDGPE